MQDNFSNTQQVRKRVIATRGGVVAAQHKRAAVVGAAVLEAGGDAVDAAIATSFAIGVVEPWMSGPAAGGCMTCGALAKPVHMPSTTACARRWNSTRPTTPSPATAGSRNSSRGRW